MRFKDLKQILNDNDLYIWQLAKTMEINPATLYKYAHYDFKGHTDQLFKGLSKLGIEVQKGSSNHEK